MVDIEFPNWSPRSSSLQLWSGVLKTKSFQQKGLKPSPNFYQAPSKHPSWSSQTEICLNTVYNARFTSPPDVIMVRLKMAFFWLQKFSKRGISRLFRIQYWGVVARQVNEHHHLKPPLFFRLVILERCGHGLHLERPDAVAQTIFAAASSWSNTV